MTIYSINTAIAWASSGVEYAQAYRATVFRKLQQDGKFIFTNMFQSENLQHYTSNIGLKDEEVIWLYTFFTDQKIAPSTYKLEDLEKTFSEPISKVEQSGKLRKYHFKHSNTQIVVVLCGEEEKSVQRVEYLHANQLIRKDYYSYIKVFSEYYLTQENAPKLYLRTFFNEDGSIAYQEHCDGVRSVFQFPSFICYSKDELIACMLQQLQLRNNDILLLDRVVGIAQAVFENKGNAKLAVVVHAEHYNKKASDDYYILWNNYYEYQFTNAHLVDAFITSTEVQKALLEKQFATYTRNRPKIYAIPVGSVSKLMQSDIEKTPYSIMTASRLATEKHLDWLVSAVILARKSLPVELDIYGEGSQRSLLQELIQKASAQDYIRLQGHQDLSEIYPKYQLYLTGSTSEGFGLTLLEAVSAGLPMIGLDVPYGNQTFIRDGNNGYLIPDNIEDSSAISHLFAEKILQFYQEMDISAAQQCSYQIAKEFLQENVEAKWQDFILEVLS